MWKDGFYFNYMFMKPSDEMTININETHYKASQQR